MRYVPSFCLKAGMVLGDNLYGFSNELLLSKGQALTEREIDRIKNLGYQGIYIEDEVSDEDSDEESDTPRGLNTRLKNNVVISLKEVFRQVQLERSSESAIKNVKSAVYGIVDEIIDNENAIINMIDLKIYDEYTYYHSVNVAVFTVLLGYAMGFIRDDLYKLALGATLHDIGKVFVPKEILEKPGVLTPEELDTIQKHVILGDQYLKDKWQIPSESHYPVLMHHERYDGSGYPNGTSGENIPLFGRVTAVADVYDALTSDRPYRKSMLPSEAVEYIMGGSGNMFDPDVVEVFLNEIFPYPVGTCVLLSNGLKGVVVENYAKYGMRPKVKIHTENGPPVYYDLYNDMSLLDVTIKGITYF